jgi:predicted  nucleic acid-binding Zn-ribbon protein
MKRSEQSNTPTPIYAEYKRLEQEMGQNNQTTGQLQADCMRLQHARDTASVAARKADDRVTELQVKLAMLRSAIDAKRVQHLVCKHALLETQISAEKAWIARGSPRDQVPDRGDSPQYLALKAEYNAAKAEYHKCNDEQRALDQEIEPMMRETAMLAQLYQAACEALQNHYTQCVEIEIAFRKARIASDTEILAKIEGRKRSKCE